jgi:NAD(P)-dependent dehydrogenase (short-subunit alcohol dehydrogenase family)
LYKGKEAVESIKAEVSDANLHYMIMELKELDSVRKFAQEYISSSLPLHILINNAGIMNTPFEITNNGYEAQFQVNHLGHFLLTHHLLPLIRRSGGGRVVNLSSRAHMRWSGPLDLEGVRTETMDTYDGWRSYGRSKLSNILFSRYLAKRFPLAESGVSFNALHPGLVDTKLLNTGVGSWKSLAIPVSEGCKCSLYVATSPEVDGVSGEYFHDSAIASDPGFVSDEAKSDVEAERLWFASLAMVGLADEDYGV